jgi:DUF917 family protein
MFSASAFGLDGADENADSRYVVECERREPIADTEVHFSDGQLGERSVRNSILIVGHHVRVLVCAEVGGVESVPILSLSSQLFHQNLVELAIRLLKGRNH